MIAQLDKYNFTLPVKHLNWTHNLILMQQVKDIRARYWYMVQSITNHWTTRYLQEAIKLDDYSKLNFYCSAVDDILCREGDNRTIGLLLCKTKDRIKAEYALRDIQKPIGISDYELGQALPEDFRGSLPTIEEIENELTILIFSKNVEESGSMAVVVETDAFYFQFGQGQVLFVRLDKTVNLVRNGLGDCRTVRVMAGNAPCGPDEQAVYRISVF